ncbi:MAG: DnaD domain protein [Clostridia bacterium]|nr:DnaD domain protein [Clostridia bacterium]
MAFVRVGDIMKGRAFTSVQNKFISKYLKTLSGDAVRVYLYALYVGASSMDSFTAYDVAHSLDMEEEHLVAVFRELEQNELITITSTAPLEIEIEDCSNLMGKPKTMRTNEHADFCKSVQPIISGRNVLPNEYRDYIFFLDEYGIEDNALLQIIAYCVTLKGDAIGHAYIKKVIHSFIDEGCVTTEKVSEKLAYLSNVSAGMIRIFNELGIKRKPELDDDNYYRKWVEMGFPEKSIALAGKLFKTKSVEKIDEILRELYNNKKFDDVEIRAFHESRSSVYAAAKDIARNLGVYMGNADTYVDTFVNRWFDEGYTGDVLKLIASRCFRKGKKSFEDMDEYIKTLINEGIVDKGAVEEHIAREIEDDKLVSAILSACGLTRGIASGDREKVALWKNWGFDSDMLIYAASLSESKNIPLAYMSKILSRWKSDGVFTKEEAEGAGGQNGHGWDKSRIESYYSELRQTAEEKAENVLRICMEDEEFSAAEKQLSALSVELAFAEVRNPENADPIQEKIKFYDEKKDEALSRLGFVREDLKPKYSCPVCGDTGYDSKGRACKCLKKLIGEK